MRQWWPRLVDRYILRQMLGWYAAVVGVIVALLWLETLPRLIDQLGKVREGAALIAGALLSLVPEYISIGIPLAVFLGTALTFRRLALAGEIDVLAGAGLSDRRLLRWPVIVALASCLLLFGLRGFWQPAGERRLDAIGLAVASGDYGIGLDAGVPHSLAPGTGFYFSRIRPDHVLEGVFVQLGRVSFSARAAQLYATQDGTVVLSLANGVIVSEVADQGSQVAKFRSLNLAVPILGPQPVARQTPRERLDRYALPDLLALPPGPSSAGLSQAMAIASASGRIASILFCGLLPVFAFALAIPPKRSRSSIGIGVGLVLIITFWKLAALIEDQFVEAAPVVHMAVLLFFAAGALWLLRQQRRHGHGAVEAMLEGAFGRIAAIARARFGRRPSRP
jgi:lipopolysaccharide export system permease protein